MTLSEQYEEAVANLLHCRTQCVYWQKQMNRKKLGEWWGHQTKAKRHLRQVVSNLMFDTICNWGQVPDDHRTPGSLTCIIDHTWSHANSERRCPLPDCDRYNPKFKHEEIHRDPPEGPDHVP